METMNKNIKKKHNFDHALKFINFYTVIRWLQLKWKNDKLIVDQYRGKHEKNILLVNSTIPFLWMG